MIGELNRDGGGRRGGVMEEEKGLRWSGWEKRLFLTVEHGMKGRGSASER
jgi:hypothetical protein